MVNLQIRYYLLYFYPIIFFRSIIAGLIRPVVVVLLLLTRNLFIIFLYPLLFFSTFGCISCVISSSNNSFKLFVVYHPPSSFMSTFFIEFESLLEFHISSKLDLIFVGDFNIHVDDLNDSNSLHFLKLLNTFNLCQQVSLPTHNSGHILDFIITNASSNLVICPYMLDTYISDHKTVCVDIDLPKPTLNKITFSYRPIKKINFPEFNQDISDAFSKLDNFDIESLIDQFNSNMSSILNKYAPLETVTVKPRISNPWFTSFLLSEKAKDDNWSELGIKPVMNQTG